jgi:predicted DNA-binding WGR domain protein
MSDFIKNCKDFLYCEYQGYRSDKYWGCFVHETFQNTLVRFWGGQGHSPQIKTEDFNGYSSASSVATNAYYSKISKGYNPARAPNDLLSKLESKLRSISFPISAVQSSSVSVSPPLPSLSTQERRLLAIQYVELLSCSNINHSAIIAEAKQIIPEINWDLSPTELCNLRYDEIIQ